MTLIDRPGRSLSGTYGSTHVQCAHILLRSLRSEIEANEPRRRVQVIYGVQPTQYRIFRTLECKTCISADDCLSRLWYVFASLRARANPLSVRRMETMEFLPSYPDASDIRRWSAVHRFIVQKTPTYHLSWSEYGSQPSNTFLTVRSFLALPLSYNASAIILDSLTIFNLGFKT